MCFFFFLDILLYFILTYFPEMRTRQLRFGASHKFRLGGHSGFKSWHLHNNTQEMFKNKILKNDWITSVSNPDIAPVSNVRVVLLFHLCGVCGLSSGLLAFKSFIAFNNCGLQ